MYGSDDSMAYYERLFHSPPPPSRLRGVPPLSEKKVDVGAHRVLLTKFREVHYINFISR